MSKAKLRVCASCEWIFHIDYHQECPKCGFGHYGAHYVYGKKAYRYWYTQEPWIKRELDFHHSKLMIEVKKAEAEIDAHVRKNFKLFR